MAEINHFVYGPITPVLAYALSALGALLGLTCTAKARSASGGGRRAWYLLLAAWAIGGTGIWVMHFMAMLGFGVRGSEIRYDVPITAVSAIIAIVFVMLGVFTVGLGRAHPVKIIIGGVLTGLGVAAMHYTGMAAMQVDGRVEYDIMLVAASVAIAVVAATVALWFTVTVRRPAALIASAMVMGVAVCGMHYTGMLAMEVHVHGVGEPTSGATAFALILPILLLVLLVIVGLVSALLASPNELDRVDGAYLADRTGQPAGLTSGATRAGPGPAGGDGFSGFGGGGPGGGNGSAATGVSTPPGTGGQRPGKNGNPFPPERRQAIPRSARR